MLFLKLMNDVYEVSTPLILHPLTTQSIKSLTIYA